jgi:hypothetical protein
MQIFHMVKMIRQFRQNRLRQGDGPIFFAFAVMHRQNPRIEIVLFLQL